MLTWKYYSMLVFCGGGIWKGCVCVAWLLLFFWGFFCFIFVGFVLCFGLVFFLLVGWLFFLNWALNLELGQMLQSAFKGFDQVWLLLFVSYPAGWAELEMEMNGPAGHREVEEVVRLNCSPVAWKRSYFLSTLCAYWRLKGGIGKKGRKKG